MCLRQSQEPLYLGTDAEPDNMSHAMTQLCERAGEEGRVQVQGFCWQAAISEGLTPAPASSRSSISVMQRNVYIAWKAIQESCVAALAAKGYDM